MKWEKKGEERDMKMIKIWIKMKKGQKTMKSLPKDAIDCVVWVII